MHFKISKPIIIDSNGLCHRCQHGAKGVYLSHNEIPTEVIFGFLSYIFILSQRFNSNNFVFCWDSLKSFRKIDYPEYKQARKKDLTEEDIERRKRTYQQISLLRTHILPKMGFTNNFVQTGVEADDLMHISAMNFWNLTNEKSIIVTTDKDLYQTLDYADILDSVKNKIITSGYLKTHYGVTPTQWGIAKSISGCTSDGVQGVKGAADPAHSERSKALAYVSGKLKKGKIFSEIKSNFKLIERNKSLIILPHYKTKSPIYNSDYQYSIDKFISVFEQYGLNSFLQKDRLAIIKEFFTNG